LPWTLRMTLYAFAVVIIPYLFVGWRLKNALALVYPDYKKQIKRIIIAIFIFLNLLPFIVLISYFTGDIRLFTHSTRINLIDFVFVFPFWIGFLAIFEIFFYFLGLDILQFISKRILKDIYIKYIAYGKIIFFALFFIYVILRSYSDTYTIQNSSHTLPVKNLPAELDGLKLVNAGDIQIDRFTQEQKISAFTDHLHEINPDLLFFAGDLVTRGTYYIPQGLKVMCNTSARIDRIACIGDHDVWSNVKQVSDGFKKCGWTYLDDDHHLINYKGRRILITGITYVYSKRITPGKLKPLLASAPEADLKILLVHQPSQLVINFAAEYGYDIMFAGHTHGGQIVFKPFGLTITPTMFENNYYSGHYPLGNLNLFVTNGIGLTMMPLRFRAPAEVQQVIITRK